MMATDSFPHVNTPQPKEKYLDTSPTIVPSFAFHAQLSCRMFLFNPALSEQAKYRPNECSKNKKKYYRGISTSSPVSLA